mmetsp:Transcript_39108/g.111763  ORF Transcript_39108/g.111763 Transcript_39108/m.111763 type:complete len:107 (-) Transcript_39108:1071-1391(-)
MHSLSPPHLLTPDRHKPLPLPPGAASLDYPQMPPRKGHYTTALHHPQAKPPALLPHRTLHDVIQTHPPTTHTADHKALPRQLVHLALVSYDVERGSRTDEIADDGV